MDDRRFDALVRSLASGQSRRTVLKGLLGLGGLAAGAGVQVADAARRPAPNPTVPKCPGRQTWNGVICGCPTGSDQCGAECCDTGVSVCCDNACCHGECYGEELCCPAGRVVCDGTCCASGEQCCERNGTGVCVPANVTCCASDADCASHVYCDQLVAHHSTCVDWICADSIQNCQGSDVCTSYGCLDGVCSASPILNCCESDTECQAVDACTPADCLDTHTCNAVSTCAEGTFCSTEGECIRGAGYCTQIADCRQYDYCAFPNGYPHDCVEGVCIVQFAKFCLGIDNCYTYGCSNEGSIHCTSEFIPGCCNEWNGCAPVDDCTPGLCLANNTCNTVSNCGTGEHCCDDGSCSQGGSCGPTGCTIEGVQFPPCVDGCNVCVGPVGGTICGCAVTTTQHCTSSDLCQEIFGDAICSGAAICVQPSGPLN
ncbi:MAG TPA: hypothetical protein VFP05_02425 [Thermomicrobiales bacterium]|nr:hypothetical protein [Thermomicrobiales bacterium]